MSDKKFTYATATNANYLEEQYDRYLKDPASVEESWRKFFEGYDFAVTNGAGNRGAGEGDQEAAKVEAYINAFRVLGHRSAHLNPLAPKPAIRPDMTPENHGLKDVNRSRKFVAANLPSDAPRTFDEITQLMQETYCSKIGAEFRDNDDIEFVRWIQDKMESCRNKPKVSRDEKLSILDALIKAEGFETFLQARFLGQKRFSLEGTESFMPLLETLTTVGAAHGVEEVVMGMAHRGRLGTLCNFIGKSYEAMLKKFEGSEFNPFQIDGDVKYHMGFAGERGFGGKNVRLYLSPNPSHLEIVNPVVEGFARARQRLMNDQNRKKVLPLLIHGDAAFIGQGSVAETLNLASLPGYSTGGTVHVIINNQVGFTTDPSDSRSCEYASGIAKILKAPVLHVNADDPEAVIWTAQLAAEYRQKFQKDFVIDLVGYRRHGHNETDEPGFTQPGMYKIIAKHPTVLTQYGERLVAEGVISADELKKRQSDFRARLQEAYDLVKSGDNKSEKFKDKYPKSFDDVFHPVHGDEADIGKPVKTGVSAKVLAELGKRMVSIPAGFNVHPKLVRLLEQRSKMLDGDGPGVDWPMAELLAFATLAKDGHHIRLSGQDCQRGTFSSRQAVLRDFETGKPHFSMSQVASNQAEVEIINSPLSELAVMGFDFGYSVADKDSLVLWEGQFGDFVNGAQIVIDQFLVASEAKWGQTSGLVLLLPHGYEGMGPEHSSGRPERFLQLCGNLNIQVAIPTTAAQYFHVLRRQICRDFRKPLVIMSPKSLLRHPKVVSPLEAFEKGQFEEVIDDERIKDAKNVKRVVLCSGKIFYEMLEATSTAPEGEVALVRVEQLYPFPAKKLAEVMARYKNIKDAVWAQEEPQNMGAWTFIRSRIEELLPESVRLKYVGRRDAGTTAEGSTKAHAAEQARIINEAINPSVTSVSSAKSNTKR